MKRPENRHPVGSHQRLRFVQHAHLPHVHLRPKWAQRPPSKVVHPLFHPLCACADQPVSPPVAIHHIRVIRYAPQCRGILTSVRSQLLWVFYPFRRHSGFQCKLREYQPEWNVHFSAVWQSPMHRRSPRVTVKSPANCAICTKILGPASGLSF